MHDPRLEEGPLSAPPLFAAKDTTESRGEILVGHDSILWFWVRSEAVKDQRPVRAVRETIPNERSQVDTKDLDYPDRQSEASPHPLFPST